MVTAPFPVCRPNTRCTAAIAVAPVARYLAPVQIHCRRPTRSKLDREIPLVVSCRVSFCDAATPRRFSTAAGSGAWSNAGDGLTVNFNPVDPGTRASVTASPHQLTETNLLHPAKVRILYPLIDPPFDDILDIEIPPPNISKLDL